MDQRALILLISPPHQTDPPLQEMAHLAWLTLAHLTQNDDSLPSTPQTTLYLVTPGLINHVNSPLSHSETELEELNQSIRCIATHFKIKNADIHSIQLSDYLCQSRQDQLRQLSKATDIDTPGYSSHIHQVQPTILPLKETLLPYLALEELPQLYQLLHTHFDQDPDRTTLPALKRGKQDIRAMIWDIIQEAKSTFEKEETRSVITAYKTAHPHLSTDHFIRLLEQDLTGTTQESLKRLFTSQYAIHEMICENIPSKRKKEGMVTSSSPSILPLSESYLALETVAFFKWIQELELATHDKPVYFTYISAHGTENLKATEKGITFFNHLLSAALWYQKTTHIQSKYQPIITQNTPKEAVQKALSTQLLFAIQQLKDRNEPDKIKKILLSITDYSPYSPSDTPHLSHYRASMRTLLESGPLCDATLHESLKEAWSTLKSKEQKLFAKEFILKLEANVFLKNYRLLLLGEIKETINKEIKNFVERAIKAVNKLGERGGINDLISNWLTLELNPSEGEPRIQVSTQLMNELCHFCSHSNYPIIQGIIYRAIQLPVDDSESHIILKALATKIGNHTMMATPTEKKLTTLEYIELTLGGSKIKRGLSQLSIRLPTHSPTQFTRGRPASSLDHLTRSPRGGIFNSLEQHETTGGYKKSTTLKGIPDNLSSLSGGMQPVARVYEPHYCRCMIGGSSTLVPSTLPNMVQTRGFLEPNKLKQQFRLQPHAILTIDTQLWISFGLGVICALLPALWFLLNNTETINHPTLSPK